MFSALLASNPSEAVTKIVTLGTVLGLVEMPDYRLVPRCYLVSLRKTPLQSGVATIRSVRSLLLCQVLCYPRWLGLVLGFGVGLEKNYMMSQEAQLEKKLNRVRTRPGCRNDEKANTQICFRKSNIMQTGSEQELEYAHVVLCLESVSQ